MPITAYPSNVLKALSGVFSPNLIDQSSCKMGLVLACMVRILHDDWSNRSGENRSNRALKYASYVGYAANHISSSVFDYIPRFTFRSLSDTKYSGECQTKGKLLRYAEKCFNFSVRQ